MLILQQDTLSKVILHRGTRRNKGMLNNSTASILLGKRLVSLKDGMSLSHTHTQFGSEEGCTVSHGLYMLLYFIKSDIRLARFSRMWLHDLLIVQNMKLIFGNWRRYYKTIFMSLQYEKGSKHQTDLTK